MFVLCNLFFEVIDFFGVGTALDEEFNFLLEFFVVLEVLFDSLFEFFVFLFVEIDVFNIVFNE
jgi:hypothetical protein